MRNFNDWDKRGKSGPGQFNKRGSDSRFEKRDFRGPGGFDKPKFQAVCAECGDRCEVPFKPVQGKPVYCNNCFHKDERPCGDRRFGGGRDDRGSRNDRFPRENRFAGPTGGSDNRTDFEQLNRKMDAIIELLKNLKVQPAKEPTVHTVAKAETEAKKDAALAAKEEKKPAKKAATKTEKKPAKKAKK